MISKLNIIKIWIQHLLKVRRCSWTAFEKEGKRFLTIVVIKGREVKRYNFAVEHLLNDNCEVTEETLRKEDEIFTKFSSNR